MDNTKAHGTMRNTNKNRRKIFILSGMELIILLIGAISAGCQADTGHSIPSTLQPIKITPTMAPAQSSASPEETGAQPTEQPVLETPTPAPTATPGQLDYLVENITRDAGLNQLTVFGLNGEDLVNVFISVVIILLGGLSALVIVNGLRWFANRTPPKFDNRLVAILEQPLKLLVTLFFLQFATARLELLSPGLKQWLDLIYFAVYVLAFTILAWKLVDYALEDPLLRISSPDKRNLLITFTPLLRRSLQVLIILTGLAIVLQNFGFKLTALLAVLGLGGLAVSLAAKETLEDIINGFILLIDRPFQIGDRIKVESMDTWGDVEDISARTTQIRTLDNRLVIVPNSIMGNSQVENYTSSDPSYRVDVSLGIAYGSDIDQVIEILEGAILSVEGINNSEPPLVNFLEFGDSAMVFQIFYWLESYLDIRLRTKVNKAIIEALEEVHIEMPFTTYDINLAYKERLADSQR